MRKVLGLKEYQQSAHRAEKAELEEALSLIETVLPLYKHAFLDEYWPYIAKNGLEPTPYRAGEYSSSTNAMIMVMLLDICNKVGFANEEEKILDNISKAKLRYLREVFKEGNQFDTYSKSYGKNDPLNLLWAHTLCKDVDPGKLSSVETIIKDKVCVSESPRELKSLLEFDKSQDNDQQEHSFIVLYAYRCAKQAKCHEGITEKYYSFFELRLHQHLSFKSIPDSRFDPSELVFCLEGMLLCKRSSVSDEILNRVFEVLGEAQDTTPCWRPVNPIYATPQGRIFLPLSIEVGMSLLNIFTVVDSISWSQGFFAKYLPILQRYFRWLKAQEKTISIQTRSGPQDVSGWESEHVGNEGVIHIWQTALILDYLASYVQLLKQHIARQYLISSGLSVEYFENVEECESCFFKSTNPFPEYEDDPEFKYNLPNYVLKHFISKHKIGAKAYSCCPSFEGDNIADEAYSLLLFGPPGTGKTYFTKKLATCLRWKHITVTPSDFLADGSAEIEARAKGIFSCLMAQEKAVILFDEIDQFILNRDSKRYREQTDIFKLLTPGMLPKFQDLRDNAKCIFIIATNYADRIDPAIVRPGRVDLKIPLMPPSWSKRKSLCTEAANKLNKAELNDYDFSELASHTHFFTWKELTKFLKINLPKSTTSWESCIAKNAGTNLSFSKVLQRIESEPEAESRLTLDKKEHEIHDSIIEELVLMCIAYGKETNEGKRYFIEAFTGYDKIIQKVIEGVKQTIPNGN